MTTVFIPSNEIIGPSFLSWNFKQRQRGSRTIDSTHVLRMLVGGNANIGKKERLWKPLGVHVGKYILTACCICQWSDFALDSVQAEVPEFSIWLTNALSFVSFFRASPRRRNLLHKENEQFLDLP